MRSNKKKKKIELSTGVAIASLLMSVISLVWIGGFRMSTVLHEIKDLKEDVQEIKNRLDRMEIDLHQHDIRINTLEQRKH